MNRSIWKSAAAGLVAAFVGFYGSMVLADYTILDSASVTQTVKAFVCETTKICTSHVNINSSGTEVGTSGAPIRIDPTGSTTQPVSGTVAFSNSTLAVTNAGTFATQATQAGAWNVTNISGTVSLPTLASTSTKQSDGTQKTQIVDGAGSVIASTSNNLNVQCANCSGSGVSTADAATFTASTSIFAGTGGFFQTTATSNALTNGQQGMFQVTANRALFTNLRNAAGTEVATAGAPLRIDPTGSTTQPVSGTVAFSNSTIAVTNAGTFAVQAALAAETTKVIGTVRNVGNVGGVLDAIGQNVAAPANWLQTGCQFNTSPTTITSTNGSPLQCDNGGKLLVNPGTVTVTATNLSTNIAQIGGTTIVAGGVAGSQSVGGTVATNVAITANPLNLGAQAVSSENAAVTTARQVQLVADLVGKLIVLPYSNPENFVSGVITSAMTGTTSTSLVAAPAAGLRNYITACTFSNAHATVGTDIIIQDGSGGTTIWNVPAAAVYGGAHITFPTPLRQPTTATAIYVANATTGASTKAACSGYKGA